jgi:hypothetical protein
MQPAWREGEPLVKNVPVDADWTPLVYGGSNGLSLVVVALSWWVCAVQAHNAENLNAEDLDAEVLDAIRDVTWVLSKLIVVLSSEETSSGIKRPGEESPNQPKSKR